MANKHQNILYPASAVCFCMLLLGIIFPYSHASDAADAAEPVIDPATYGLALNLNSSVDINIDPSIAGKLQVETQSIGIKANSPNGYQLLFAVDGNDNNIYLNGETTADKTKTIYATNSADLALSSDRFAQWGYSTTSTTSFSALPTTGNEVQLNSKTSSTSGDFDVTTINYGIKANLGLSSGAYTTRINYIAISNVADVLYAAAIAEGKKEFSPADVAAGSATTIVATGLAMTGKALTPSDLTVQIGTTTVPTADITITQQLPNLILNVKLPTTLTVGNYAVTITLNNSHVASNFKSYTIAENDGIVVKPSVLYMQDVATWKSQLANTGDSMQVVDKRDNKMYWVTKLADGNIWMTQNLDLDLSTSKTLTPDDTDVATNYTPAVNTTTGNTFNSSDYTGENSWDGGDYYWKGTWNGSSQNSNLGYSYFSTYFSTNVADAGAAAEHYHVGNLYQWSAATAKTGNGLTSGAEATSSICPKGWRLPYSGDNTTDKSFGFMLSKYSLTSSNTDHKINTSPLFFVPAGYVISGKLYGGAYYGNYWSSRAYSTTNTGNAYYLYFDTSSVDPSDSDGRYYGYSVRCVAR